MEIIGKVDERRMRLAVDFEKEVNGKSLFFYAEGKVFMPDEAGQAPECSVDVLDVYEQGGAKIEPTRDLEEIAVERLFSTFEENRANAG